MLALCIVTRPAAGGQTCPADMNGDATVDVVDLLFVLSQWGEGSGTSDFWGAKQQPDGWTDVLDLLALLDAWGPC